MPEIPGAKDRPLFTPGPLTTSRTVKQAMLRDLGSRDGEFIETVRRVRAALLDLAGVSREQGFEAVLMQGSGTFGIESVIASTVPPDGKLLVIINGAYGERIERIASVLKIDTALLRRPENTSPSAEDVDRALAEDPAITTVAVVHCETTTGIMNSIESIGRVVKKHDAAYFVDSMSAFGAVPFDFEACAIDYLVSSANKCIEGVPGFSFAICRHDALVASEGWARSLSLDLLAQWRGLGFQEYLKPELQGHIITSFRYPDDPSFVFEEFYERLGARGFVIYPGKVSDADCFRIGSIGRIFEADVRALLVAIGETMVELGVWRGESA